MKVRRFSFVLLIGALSYMACTKKDDLKGSEQNDAVHIVDYDQALRRAQEQGTIDSLIQKYPVFSEVYAYGVIDHNLDPDLELSLVLDSIASYDWYQGLKDTFEHIVPDHEWLKKELSEAIRSYGQVMELDSLPTVYMCLTGWDYAAFTIEGDRVGLAKEFFLGADFPYPSYEVFPHYVRRSMNPDHMTMRALRALIENHMTIPESDRMIDVMCYNGRVLYLLDQMLTNTADTVIFDYSADELAWCEDNEFEIWRYFLDQELIYEGDLRRVSRYTNVAPHSPGMPDEAPGRTGNWIGYHIVREWVERQQPSLDEILHTTDGQVILDAARYKGGRK